MTSASMLTLPDGVRIACRDVGRVKHSFFIKVSRSRTRSGNPWSIDCMIATGASPSIPVDTAAPMPDQRYTVGRLAADLKEIADQLDLRDVTVVGHSLAALSR